MKKENKIQIQKTARYFTLGSPTDKIKSIWFVLHGYGNSAYDFIDDFNVLNNGDNYIIVPEALNKFYLKGFYGKVGATWMTKENREDEINDYVNFLNSVYENEIKNFEREKIKINILGFSQGVPTSVRWLCGKKLYADNFIVWAGDIPKDSEPELVKSVLKNTNIFYVIGNEDKIIDKERLKVELDKIEKLELNYKLIQFNGGHKIDHETLSKLF